MSHGDHVTKAPPGFDRHRAHRPHPDRRHGATKRKRWYGVQFHPGSHAHQAGRRRCCAASSSTSAAARRCGPPRNIIDDQIARVRAQVGTDEVMLGLSGGVDSSVVAALLHKAIGDQLTCVFVDTGLLRWNEGDQVMAMFAEHMGVKVIRVDAADRYFNALEGVADPEAKRKIIGNLFVEIFDEESHEARQREVAGAGHDLSGRDRVGRQQDRQGARHQEPPQRRRPARAHEARPGRAAARAVQGRSAPPRRRARPAARDGLSPSVPGPGPGRAHPRRGQARVRRAAGAGRRTSSSRNCARPICTTRPARPSRCSCR